MDITRYIPTKHWRVIVTWCTGTYWASQYKNNWCTFYSATQKYPEMDFWRVNITPKHLDMDFLRVNITTKHLDMDFSRVGIANRSRIYGLENPYFSTMFLQRGVDLHFLENFFIHMPSLFWKCRLKDSIHASILNIKLQEICTETNLWKFHLVVSL